MEKARPFVEGIRLSGFILLCFIATSLAALEIGFAFTTWVDFEWFRIWYIILGASYGAFALTTGSYIIYNFFIKLRYWYEFVCFWLIYVIITAAGITNIVLFFIFTQPPVIGRCVECHYWFILVTNIVLFVSLALVFLLGGIGFAFKKKPPQSTLSALKRQQ